MSFKDLTDRAAAAMKPKPEVSGKTPPDSKAAKAGTTGPATKPQKS